MKSLPPAGVDHMVPNVKERAGTPSEWLTGARRYPTWITNHLPERFTVAGPP